MGERRAYRLVHSRRHLVVSQLGLGLSFELWLGHFYRYYGRETLAEVVAVDVYLELGELAAVLCVLLERTGEGPAEAGEVCTAFYGVDVVDV